MKPELRQPFMYEGIHVNHKGCTGRLWYFKYQNERILIKCDKCDDIDPNQYELKI